MSAVFVTNGIVHAKKLISKGFKTYMAGGLIRAKTEAVVGSEAVESIKNSILQNLLSVLTEYIRYMDLQQLTQMKQC